MLSNEICPSGNTTVIKYSYIFILTEFWSPFPKLSAINFQNVMGNVIVMWPTVTLQTTNGGEKLTTIKFAPIFWLHLRYIPNGDKWFILLGSSWSDHCPHTQNMTITWLSTLLTSVTTIISVFLFNTFNTTC